MEEKTIDATLTPTSELSPPLPFIIIQCLEGKSVNIIRDAKGLTKVLVNDNIEYKGFTTAFQKILFLGAKNCVIKVQAKILMLTFLDCKGIIVKLEENIIGVIDVIRCENVRMTVEKDSPIIRADLSTGIHFLSPPKNKHVYVFEKCYPQNTINGVTMHDTSLRDDQLFVQAEDGELSVLFEPLELNSVEMGIVIN